MHRRLSFTPALLLGVAALGPVGATAAPSPQGYVLTSQAPLTEARWLPLRRRREREIRLAEFRRCSRRVIRADCAQQGAGAAVRHVTERGRAHTIAYGA
jgi:hypothetical protein